MGGDDDDGGLVSPLAQAGEHLHAPHARHLKVEQDQVEVLSPEPGERGLSVRRGADPVVVRFERGSEDEPDVRLVLHDQGLGGSAHHAPRFPWAAPERGNNIGVSSREGH